MLRISINQVPDFINLAFKSKNNILLVGNPGVGKSQIIENMRSDKCKVTTMTGSSTIEEYVNGIPQVVKYGDKNILEYISQRWFVDMEEFAEENPDGMQILFLDEFNTADPQVLKTFLTILAERRIPTLNKSIPEQVVIVAAMNPNSQNDTERLIRPMASRFMVLNVISSMDSYRDYIEGKEQKSILDNQVKEEETEVTNEQKIALLEQISETEWNSYDDMNEDKSYHEINPRSFTNFVRSLGYIKDKSKATPALSEAFLGKKIAWVEDAEKIAEKRKEKVNSGSVVATEEEMRAMTVEGLEQYLEKIKSPTIVGPKYRQARIVGARILREKKAEEMF